MKNIFNYIFLISIIIFSISCDKNDDNPDPENKGTMTLKFDNVVGDRDLNLNIDTYTNV